MLRAQWDAHSEKLDGKAETLKCKEGEIIPV